MLSIEKCRTLLEEEADLTDDQVGRIRDELYETAQIAYEVYMQTTTDGFKNPFGLLMTQSDEDMV